MLESVETAGSRAYAWSETLRWHIMLSSRYLHRRGDGRAVPRELDRKTADVAELDLRLEEIGMSN